MVVTEGNYLLHDDHGWEHIASLLDESWYIDLPDDERQRRLITRREGHGDDPDHARSWVLGVDQANARTVAATRDRADRIVRLRPRARDAVG